MRPCQPCVRRLNNGTLSRRFFSFDFRTTHVAHSGLGRTEKGSSIAFGQVTQLCGVCLPQTFDFLPAVPAAISPFFAFGIALLVSAATADALFRTRRIPRVATYIVLGMVFGAPGLKWVSPDMAGLWRPAVDVALGIVLFRLGQRLDLAWRRRHPPLPAVERPADLRQAAFPRDFHTLRLPGQAIHRFRPARAPRLLGRKRGPDAAAPALALHPAVHCAFRLLALRAGAGYGFRFGPPQFGLCLPAIGPGAARHYLG